MGDVNEADAAPTEDATDFSVTEDLEARRKRAKMAVAGSSPKDFVHDWLLSTSPFAFEAYSSEYFNFRQEISALLGVHSADLTLVGSAQLGFSLNPSKLMSHFGRESDLDVAVVSSVLFDEAWCELIRSDFGVFLLDVEEKKKFKKMRENFFEGYLRPDLIPGASELAKNWFPKLAGPFKSNVARRHEVKAWLFKSWWHFEAFYVAGIQKAQPSLIKFVSDLV